MADHSTLQRITEVWESMSGGPEGWLKSFGYEQFALAIIAEFVPQSDEEPVGRAHPLAGSEGGFTMCAWRSSEVPNGTPLYTHQAVTKTSLDHFIDDVEAAESAWQPIETAPRLNGQRVLLSRNGGNGPFHAIGYALDGMPGWHSNECRGMETLEELGYSVTHWMPLPRVPGDQP